MRYKGAMRVIVRSILKLKEALGGDIAIEVPGGTTVGGLLARMLEAWGEGLSPHLLDPETHLALPYVRIMVNGQTIRFLKGMETVLNEGDEVLLLPLAAGG